MRNRAHVLVIGLQIALLIGIAIGNVAAHSILRITIISLAILTAILWNKGIRRSQILLVLVFAVGIFWSGLNERSIKVEQSPNQAQAWVAKNLDAGFSQPESFLVAALISGDKANIPYEIKDDFRKSGLSHLLAVSGYNVTLVAAAIVSLIKSRFNKKIQLIITTVSIFGFVLFAGAGAPVVRAGIMGGLAVLAIYSGRSNASQRALILAATLMAVYKPSLVSFDVGFQLSVAATGSIIWLTPKIRQLLKNVTDFAELRTNLATTLAANLGTLPIITVVFLTLPIYSLLTNIIVAPLIPFIMLCGFAVALLGGSFIGRLFGWFGSHLANLMLELAHFFASLPHSTIDVKSPYLFVTAEIIVLALFVLLVIIRPSKKKIKPLLS